LLLINYRLITDNDYLLQKLTSPSARRKSHHTGPQFLSNQTNTDSSRILRTIIQILLQHIKQLNLRTVYYVEGITSINYYYVRQSQDKNSTSLQILLCRIKYTQLQAYSYGRPYILLRKDDSDRLHASSLETGLTKIETKPQHIEQQHSIHRTGYPPRHTDIGTVSLPPAFSRTASVVAGFSNLAFNFQTIDYWTIYK